MTPVDRKRVLVIDDDAMNREVMEAFLSSEDYEVLLASDGHQGLEFAEAHLPHVIVLDVRMPDMSGYEVCEQLKNKDTTRSIPVIIVTGFDSREDFERGKAVGAADFIPRPFDADDLLDRVRRLSAS